MAPRKKRNLAGKDMSPYSDLSKEQLIARLEEQDREIGDFKTQLRLMEDKMNNSPPPKQVRQNPALPDEVLEVIRPVTEAAVAAAVQPTLLEFSKTVDEKLDRNNRRKNVIVFRLPELGDSPELIDQSDGKAVARLCQSAGIKLTLVSSFT